MTRGAAGFAYSWTAGWPGRIPSLERLRVLGHVRSSTQKQAPSSETQACRLRDAADVFGWDLTIREEAAASAKTLAGRPSSLPRGPTSAPDTPTPSRWLRWTGW